MNDCCHDEANLTDPHLVTGRDDLRVRECVVCGAKHYELDADAFELFGEGADL